MRVNTITVKHATDLQHPAKTAMKFRVNALKVIQCDWLSQQLLVERHGETSVKIVTVEYCHPDHTTHKVEVGQMLLRTANHFDSSAFTKKKFKKKEKKKEEKRKERD